MNTITIALTDSAIVIPNDNTKDLTQDDQTVIQAIEQKMNSIYFEVCHGADQMNALIAQWDEQRNALMSEYHELSEQFWLLREKAMREDCDRNGISYYFWEDHGHN